jgi:serine/threonine protein kinase
MTHTRPPIFLSAPTNSIRRGAPGHLAQSLGRISSKGRNPTFGTARERAISARQWGHTSDQPAVIAADSDWQRYRILRPHAQGGLGAVFIALATELHREVALKQILDEHADDPTSRQRFFLEAEVTLGLEHPGIVPVYGLGAHSHGRPYYAMRFIRGDSLKEAITDEMR